MVSTKVRRHSGRYIPHLLEPSLSHLVKVEWDDWIDRRDGFRGGFSDSWKDQSKRKYQYKLVAK